MSETRKQTAYQVAFAHGVCGVLAHLAHRDEEVIWREVVAANGGYDYLYGVSKRAGNLECDGFTRYRRESRR